MAIDPVCAMNVDEKRQGSSPSTKEGNSSFAVRCARRSSMTIRKSSYASIEVKELTRSVDRFGRDPKDNHR